MSVRPFEGEHPKPGKGVYIDEDATVIGRVSIGENSSIWPACVLRGDINTISIGARTNIQDGSVLHVTHDSDYVPGGYALSIGDEVTVGHKAMLHACNIGNRCLIGMSAIVLDGAVIEDNVVVGAGSLVAPRKRLESGYLYLGQPARRVRKLSQKELDYFVYSAEHYVRLKDRYLNQA
jgi:carbonic anhydrase/acetyltransferase-like protein (isoleucine patch superfamily)